MSEGIAGNFFVGDAPLNKVDLSPDAVALANAMSEQDLRKFVRQEVHKALDDIANEVRTNEALQPTPTTQKQAGICYACLFSGDDMERFEQGGQGVWIHKTDECRQRAIAIAEHKG